MARNLAVAGGLFWLAIVHSGTAPPRLALACGVGLFAADRPHAAPVLPRMGSREGWGGLTDVPIFPASAPAQSATPACAARCRAPSRALPLPRDPPHSRLAP